jgi:hypothetical protein
MQLTTLPLGLLCPLTHTPPPTQVVSRNPDISRPKRLYLISRQVLDLLLSDEQEQLKIISAGVKVRRAGEGGREGGGQASWQPCSFEVCQGCACIDWVHPHQSTDYYLTDYFSCVSLRRCLSGRTSGKGRMATGHLCAPIE